MNALPEEQDSTQPWKAICSACRLILQLMVQLIKLSAVGKELINKSRINQMKSTFCKSIRHYSIAKRLSLHFKAINKN